MKDKYLILFIQILTLKKTDVILNSANKHGNDSLYSPGEEKAHVITHGIGVALSLSGTVLLILRAYYYGDQWHVLSFFIFGLSLIILYVSSTLYHSFTDEALKKRLRKLDHSAIYILIAGTYTPFLLTNLRASVGWIMFFFVWTFAGTGILIKLTTSIGSKLISAVIYLVMGWLAVFIYRSMLDNLTDTSLIFLAAGGFFYTLGVLFYVWKSLPFHHAIWHLFVLGGSICHYFSIYYIL